MNYAGIGARKTPANVLAMMTRIAKRLEEKGYTLRSGGAEGADQAFAAGTSKKEVYLPWRGYNNLQSQFTHVSSEAIALAEQFHPSSHLSPGVKKLMARNCYQILGINLDDPVDFVVCWTPDGCERHQDRTRSTGGTGQAISLADSYGIPIVNLYNKGALDALKNILALNLNQTEESTNAYYSPK
jgi:hypothetical protein